MKNRKPIDLIIQKLKSYGFEFVQAHVLDIFAGEGDWQTIYYADKVKSLEAWEINSSYKSGLVKNIPKAKVKITDSVKECDKKKYFGQFDLIMIDNPQNCYGINKIYAEHFDVIPKIAKLLKPKGGVLIFNINREPFDFHQFSKWEKRRQVYYSRKHTEKISHRWLENFYKKLFLQFGYQTIWHFKVSRRDFEHHDYLYYYVYYLKLYRDEK